MLDTVLQAALADPLKTLLGSGGIVGLLVLVVKWWSGRVRLRGRFISETYDVRAEATVPTQIHIEVENLGREATSILPDVSLTYLYPHRTRASAELKVVSAERTLQPVTPRTITLKGDLPAGYLFSHFRVLRVRFSRGPADRKSVV